MLNGAHQKMKEADIRRQRALTVSLRGDQENDAFYPPSGGGYDGYTIGASTADCPDRFREGCLEDAQGALWTAYTAGMLQSTSGPDLKYEYRCTCLPVYRTL